MTCVHRSLMSKDSVPYLPNLHGEVQLTQFAMSGDKSQEPPKGSGSLAWGDVHAWADGHIRELRYVAYVMGISGAALVVYSAGLHRRYTSAADIPLSEYSRRTKLRVRITGVLGDNTTDKKVNSLPCTVR